MLSTSCFAGKAYNRVKEHPDLHFVSWFTGPLLSPTPVNMEPGHPAIEPFISVGKIYGEYNNDWNFKNSNGEWFVNPFFTVEWGITDRIGMEVIVSSISNFKKNISVTRLQDSTFLLGFQVANDIKGSWIPDVRINFQQVFPTGSYRKLSPDNLGMDATGEGAFQTGPMLIIHKVFYLKGGPLAIKFALEGLFPADIKVKGLSAYGGNQQTCGRVRAGPSIEAFFSAEYSMNKHWAGGFDALYTYQWKATFEGESGGVFVGLPPSAQFSLAPFLEYTFSDQLGALGGFWFTLSGKNSTAFISSAFALVYIF